MSRRKFLAGLSSFGAASMVPEPILKGMTGVLAAERSGKDVIGEFIRSEKQRALDDAISAVQANLRKAEVLKALRGEGWQPLSTITHAIEFPILPEHLEDTSYDTKALHERYPITFNFEIGQVRKGNGVYYEDTHSILSAAHVVHGPGRQNYPRFPVRGIDAEIFTLPSSLGPPALDQIVKLDPKLTNEDIHGHFVAIVGFDPDDKKRKTYPGVAVKMSEGLVRSFRNTTEAARDYANLFRNSFMIVLPPGEAQVKDGVFPASGMSGSPMFVHLNGQYVFAGVFWGVSPVDEATRSVEIGYAHGIDQVKEVARMRAQKPLAAPPRKISDRLPQ